MVKGKDVERHDNIPLYLLQFYGLQILLLSM